MQITYFDTDTLNYDVMELPTLAFNEKFTITEAMLNNYKEVGMNENITD